MSRAVLKSFLTATLIILALAGCNGSADSTESSTGPEAASVSRQTSQATQPSVSTSTYTFAVCGDNRTEGINNGVLGRIIASAKDRGAAFMVDTGDVSTVGSRQQLQYYKDYTQEQGMTFYSVPGNHDVGNGGVSAAWQETLGPEYYGFEYAGDHFVVLDNADDHTGISDEQMQWYTADLESHAIDPHTFIFAHIPVADPGLESGHVTGEQGNAGLESGKRMASEAHRAHTNAFFFGHVHAYLQYKLGDIPAYVSGGAGAPLVLSEAAGGYYHYLLVSVGPEGISVEVVRV